MKITIHRDEWEPTDKDGVSSIKMSNNGWALSVTATPTGIIIKALEGKPDITAVEGQHILEC